MTLKKEKKWTANHWKTLSQVLIMSLNEKTGGNHASNPTFAKFAGVDRATWIRHRQEFEEEGLIVTFGRGTDPLVKLRGLSGLNKVTTCYLTVAGFAWLHENGDEDFWDDFRTELETKIAIFRAGDGKGRVPKPRILANSRAMRRFNATDTTVENAPPDDGMRRHATQLSNSSTHLLSLSDADQQSSSPIVANATDAPDEDGPLEGPASDDATVNEDPSQAMASQASEGKARARELLKTFGGPVYMEARRKLRAEGKRNVADLRRECEEIGGRRDWHECAEHLRGRIGTHIYDLIVGSVLPRRTPEGLQLRAKTSQVYGHIDHRYREAIQDALDEMNFGRSWQLLSPAEAAS